MGALYRYYKSYIVFTCDDIFIVIYPFQSMKNGIVLLSCIFEPTVLYSY